MIITFIGIMIIPFIMVVVGYLMIKHPPQKINGIYGYRTPKSMKNIDTWNFAHNLCGKIWLKVGFIVLVVSFVIFFITKRLEEDTFGILIVILTLLQAAIIIISIIPVEKALGENFDSKGNRIK